MKSLSDCEFTAFISYAHADDVAWFGWVSDFKTELERGLQALLRGVKLPPMHLSGENGPVSGQLGEELKERIASSYAMIIVVHDNYAQSEWCLNELAYFKSLFGEEGFRDRLYILALSKDAIEQVTSSPSWRKLVPTTDQVWTRFFEEDNVARPIPIYRKGKVSDDFRGPFERVREDFVNKLRRRAAPLPMVAAPPPAAAPAAPGSRDVIFGFVDAALAPAASAAADRLRQAGLSVETLTQDAVFRNFEEFEHAQSLVLPFDDRPMLLPIYPGGHLAAHRDSWLKRSKPTDRLFWLDLRADPQAAPAPGSGAEFVAASGVRTLGVDDLLKTLRPPPPTPQAQAQASQGVHIYIESNRLERNLWQSVGEQIRRKWDEVFDHLAPDRVPPLYLRPRGLPIDDLDRHPALDDADGVVLLWGQKTSEALVAQINKVEGKLPGRDGAPGIVAYLMPPQQTTEPVPAWGWQVLRFNASDVDNIGVIDEEQDDLKRFLKRVFERRRRRDAEAAAR